MIDRVPGRVSFPLILLLVAMTATPTAGSASAAADADRLLGTWTVDLRPTPDAEPYYQTFELKKKKNGSFKGTFYGTAIENVAVNVDWGEPTLAFTTGDGSGAYHTVARLDGEILRGTTHAIGREFLSVWTATR